MLLDFADKCQWLILMRFVVKRQECKASQVQSIIEEFKATLNASTVNRLNESENALHSIPDYQLVGSSYLTLKCTENFNWQILPTSAICSAGLICMLVFLCEML